jgi:hypothetical protein
MVFFEPASPTTGIDQKQPFALNDIHALDV